MSVKAGSFSPSASSSTDLSVDNLTFLPTLVMFRVGSDSTTDTAKTVRGDGWTTANNQSYDCFFEDATGKSQLRGTDKCIRVEKRVSGTMQDAVAATFVDFHDNGGGNYGFKLNFTVADGRQIRYVASDV